MNRRQRKKQLKKTMNRMTRFFNDALKHKIGDPVNAATKSEISNIVAEHFKDMWSRPSIASQIFMVTPILRPPFRQWRELGANQLTHYVGTNPRDNANYHWVRFCDYEDAPEQYLLSHEAPVDCLRCIAREDSIYAAQADL